jgi:hypothetical protein
LLSANSSSSAMRPQNRWCAVIVSKQRTACQVCHLAGAMHAAWLCCF